MRYYFITFRSVTFAQRGEHLLREHGIACALSRTPRKMEEQGCGYCLRVSQIQPAVALLEQHQVAYRKIYFQQAPGLVQEVCV